MGIEVVHGPAGTTSEEYGILQRELGAIHAVEHRLVTMQRYDGDIKWDTYPESNGRYIGAVLSSSAEEIGIVALNRAQTAARVTSRETLKNESTARAARLFAQTFTPPIHKSSITWKVMPSGVEANDQEPTIAPAVAVVGTLQQPVIMVTEAIKKDGRVIDVGPVSRWLLYTEAEWKAFLKGGKAGEFQVDDNGPLPELSPRQKVQLAASNRMTLLRFGRGVVEVEGQFTHPIDEALVARWASRSAAGQTRFSQHTEFILGSFFSRPQSLEDRQPQAGPETRVPPALMARRLLTAIGMPVGG